MRRLFYFVIFLGFVVLLPETVLAQAGNFVTCGGPGQDACNLCHLVTMGSRIINWLIVVLTVVAGIIFAYAGLQLLASAGNVAEKDKAKTKIINLIVGYLLVLSAWLIVDTFVRVLTPGTIGDFGPWNRMECRPQPVGGGSLGIAMDRGLAQFIGQPLFVVGPEGQIAELEGTTTRGGGSCDEISDPNNQCHPDNLRNTCFGDRAEQASRICNQESGGNSNLVSGTDRCRDGRSFSGGAWQVNILAHGNEIGCDTSGFWRGSNADAQGGCLRYTRNSRGVRYCAVWNCEFRDQNAYNQCMQRAMDPTINTEQACRLYGSRGFDPWRITANHCLGQGNW